MLREGAGFFPGYQRELEIYRKSGQEFVDILRQDTLAHEQLVSLLNRAYYAEVNSQCDAEMKRRDEVLTAVSLFNQKTSPSRQAMARLAEGHAQAPEAVLQSIRTNYAGYRDTALKNLPPTPHLDQAERARLLQELSTAGHRIRGRSAGPGRNQRRPGGKTGGGGPAARRLPRGHRQF